jgi:NADH-quinone oxidoreductase subunit L
LIPLLPAAGAALNGLAGARWFSRRTSALVATAAVASAFGLALIVVWQLLVRPPQARSHDIVVASWIPGLPLRMHDGRFAPFQVDWGIHLDLFAALMAAAIAGIAVAIHLYSARRLSKDDAPSAARFFCCLNLFCASLLVLVLGGSFATMFVGWEGAGICSYLLMSASSESWRESAGRRAFVSGRMADWALLVGLFAIASAYGTLDLQAIDAATPLTVNGGRFGALAVACLLTFVAAAGTSVTGSPRAGQGDAAAASTGVLADVHAGVNAIAGACIVGRIAATIFQLRPAAVVLTMTGALILLGGRIVAGRYRMAR